MWRKSGTNDKHMGGDNACGINEHHAPFIRSTSANAFCALLGQLLHLHCQPSASSFATIAPQPADPRLPPPPPAMSYGSGGLGGAPHRQAQ
eukprot:4094737-Alexandrium_andersonii.AAC.1